ncbi:hypothetical protein D3C75_545120 [compost metagenome]
MAINMLSVQSSNLAAVGYDEASKTLHVQFKNGAVWEYTEVPAEEYQALMSADSIGSHYAKNVKKKYEGAPFNG